MNFLQEGGKDQKNCNTKNKRKDITTNTTDIKSKRNFINDLKSTWMKLINSLKDKQPMLMQEEIGNLKSYQRNLSHNSKSHKIPHPNRYPNTFYQNLRNTSSTQTSRKYTHSMISVFIPK